MTDQKRKFVGRSVPRLEDRPLLLGQGRFAADISFPGQWHMRVVRSNIARGKLKSIDASAALRLPGVHAVWTHTDVAQIPPIPFRLTGLKQLDPYRQPVLAKDAVRYVGEPVAVVFADTRISRKTQLSWSRFRSNPSQQRCTQPENQTSTKVNSRRSRESCRKGMAMSTPHSATLMPLFLLSFPSDATPAFRWKRAAPSHATTKRAMFWSCMAPPRCRTGIAIRIAQMLGRKKIPFNSTKAMSAADSVFAAKFIPKIFWSVPPR